MAMASRFRLAYHHRLFLGLVAFLWLMLMCFAVFQYHRETQFKAESLNIRLQMINDRIFEGLERNDTVFASLSTIPDNIPGLRISIIDANGKIVYDNSLDSLPGTNHLDRKEIAEAMKRGEGYALRRHSESTGGTYFYAAKRGDGYVVRSAMPYTVSLNQLLAADYAFLWVMIVVTVIMCIIGFFATRRVGRHIGRLNRFAESAERGERIFDTEPFPHDELGDISNNIVRLYARLQQAITDRDHEHRLAIHEQAEKIRIKRQLTNNMNHELKTPVASMQVCLETLMSHKNLSEEKRDEFVARCYAANERLRKLLADVSVITRMEDGGENIQKSPVCIKELVSEICDEYKEIAAEKGIEIAQNVSYDGEIEGSASLLSSIFHNLIDNALAYSGATRIEIKDGYSNSGFLAISVADNGCGVPPEHLPRLFERFYRIDKGRSRQAGGTGLGLSIVKNAVLWHGGTIKVANRRGGGLIFIFTLRADLTTA